ncbi:MAG: hypothetical protein JSU70_18435 [Phycisphaerales bacterium]|nr:MAG: hypothetical protein JSU70_18435 [Phycisphaerales bacterium]
MTLISEGIETVRAFGLPSGISQGGDHVVAPRAALVKWRSGLSDKFHQVYVNGRYAGVTIDSEQRQIVVPVPTCGDRPIHIEAFGIEAKDAHVDFGGEIEQPRADSGRVKITLLRSQGLPAGATANIYCDNGTGQVDYETPVNDSPISIWPSWQDKAGFAMSTFGLGDFGWDSAAAIGSGKGSFGYGQFGLDADAIEWVSEPMSMGSYKFGVKVTDKYGNQSNASEIDVTTTPAATPAAGLSVSSFDKHSNKLVLSMVDD